MTRDEAPAGPREPAGLPERKVGPHNDAQHRGYHLAARRAINRARSHVRAAEALSKHRQMPLAYSILVLAFEELGKAIVLKFLADGLLTADPKHKDRADYFDARSIYHGRESQRIKQSVTAGVGAQMLVVSHMVSVYLELTGKSPSEAVIEQMILGIRRPRRPPPPYALDAKTSRQLQRVRTDLTEFWKAVPYLERWKQNGFYSDLEAATGGARMERPRRARSVHALHETMLGLLEVGRDIVEGPSTKETAERLDPSFSDSGFRRPLC